MQTSMNQQTEPKESPREVFISYHTQSGGDAVRKICAALEGAGVSCWYAPRNVGTNYAHSIVEAIRGCRIFLLVLNECSNESAHVLNEINCAFDRFKEHEEITLLPFRIDQCALSDDVYYYLGRIHIMDGAAPPELLRIQELVDRVLRLLGRERSRDVTLPETAGGYGSRTYRIIGSMVYPDNHFIGREAELASMEEHLAGAENKLFLVGMGGIGKSEIARAYLKRHAQEYDVVLWLSFEGSLRQLLLSDASFPIQGLSRADFPEDSDDAYFQRKLRILKEIANRQVLLVVDNFDVFHDPDLEAFTSGDYGILFTTRCHQEASRLPQVEVLPITEESELMAIFQAEYTRALNAEGAAQVKEILGQLNGHPLSIRLVASAMQSRRISPEKMNALLKEGARNMAMENARAADLIFGRLRQVFQLSTLSEEEQYLLKNLSLISLRGISVETLFDWCGLDEFDIVDDLIRRSWVIHDPVADEVHLHPLVSDLMAEALAEDPTCCDRLIHSLADACSSTIGTSYEHKQRMLDLSSTAYARLPKDHHLRILTLRAKTLLTFSMSMYSEAIPLMEECLEQADTLFWKLHFHNWLAHCHQLGGNPSACRRIALEGLALATPPIPDEVVPLYLNLLSRLTESNRDLGNYDEAVSYARKALEYSDQEAEKERGWLNYHLARVLYMRGDLEESESQCLQALRLYDARSDAWASSFAYDLLGQVYMKQGRFEEALKLSSQAWNILLPQLGPEHIDMGNSLIWRGNIYRAMGEEEKACGCYTQAADIFRKRNCPARAEKVQELLQGG